MEKKKQWVEKYRPIKLDNVIDQEESIMFLKKIVIKKEMPHLLLYGNPGIGKTSSILALSRELFKENVEDRVLELNMSDEKGINTVRQRIKTFARFSINPKDGIPSFKIIILDEIDSMTIDAQSALRKMMEEYALTTRFCLICNYINKIIDPIKSRCSMLHFSQLDNKLLNGRLKMICVEEEIKIDDECLNTIIEISDGDGRKAITMLQNSKYLVKLNNRKINRKDILEINGCIGEDEFEKIWRICVKSSFEEIQKEVLYIKRNGYSIGNILDNINKKIIETKELNEEQKSKMSLELCKTSMFETEGCDEYIQMMNIFITINMISKNKLV